MADDPTPLPADTAAGSKEPFDIHEVFHHLRAVCARLPKAAMFQLRDEGYYTPYEQLVASLISARTLDEATIPVCHRLFARARTPATVTALTLAVGFSEPAICVDIHVHRITNRWGYVAEPTPERTMAALASKLSQQYWIEINKRLVPFGKHVCTGPRPKCPMCPLLSMCQQVGVGRA